MKNDFITTIVSPFIASLLVKHQINFNILSVKKHLIECLIKHKNVFEIEILLTIWAKNISEV